MWIVGFYYDCYFIVYCKEFVSYKITKVWVIKQMVMEIKLENRMESNGLAKLSPAPDYSFAAYFIDHNTL